MQVVSSIVEVLDSVCVDLSSKIGKPEGKDITRFLTPIGIQIRSE